MGAGVQTARGGWSPAGQLVAAVAVAEVVGAVALMGAGRAATPVLIAAAGVTFATMFVIARARMPVGMKAGLVCGVLAALLGLTATQDPLGLRAVDEAVSDSLTVRGVPAIDQGTAAPVSAPAQLSLKTSGGAEADAVIADVTAAVGRAVREVPSAPYIEGAISVRDIDGVSQYALRWSVGRNAEVRWCGDIQVAGGRRAAVDAFRAAILQALTASRGNALACF
jgi:hypothetical protein